jgi:hypothetical protein
MVHHVYPARVGNYNFGVPVSDGLLELHGYDRVRLGRIRPNHKVDVRIFGQVGDAVGHRT